ncbi:hypothetical protein [Ferruginibacter sp.]
MKTVIYLFIAAFLFSCHQKNEQVRPVTTRVSAATVSTVLNYDSCKNVIALTRKQNKAGWNALPKQQKEKIFTAAVVQTIIPSWIGTPWSFNGTSETPQQGSIACGYFVTTILRDAGLSLARIKLAQCASEQMILALVQSRYVQHFSNVNMDSFLQAIQQQGYGLYIVGLDNHTGFIYNDGSTVYFIHSTFVGTRNVQYEPAADSYVLRQSKYKVLGKISADEKVLNRWIN